MLQENLTPTPERIAKAGEKYVGPKKSQTEDRLAGKVLSSLELLQRRGALKPHQFEAGANLYFYWAGANRVTGITGSYGDQRWSGTRDSQADTETMIRPEWRTYCHQRLDEARDFINNQSMWTALTVIFEDGNAEQVGERLGKISRASKISHGKKAILDALEKLAEFYGLTAPT